MPTNHISDNFFCEVAEALITGKMQELSPEGEKAKQHIFDCPSCKKQMGKLLSVTHEEMKGNYDSFFNKEGDIIPEGLPLLSTEF